MPKPALGNLTGHTDYPGYFTFPWSIVPAHPPNRTAAGGLIVIRCPTASPARADGCPHHAAARIGLAARAAPRWREEIALGRHAGPSGRRVSRLDVALDGAPAYRGGLGVAHPPTDHSGAVLEDAGAVGSVLLVDAARAGN